jgi:hypothetical protein
MAVATFGTVWSSALPLVSAEIFTNIQWISLLVISLESSSQISYAITSLIFVTVVVGLATFALGFAYNSLRFTAPRFFVLLSVFFFCDWVFVIDDG